MTSVMSTHSGGPSSDSTFGSTSVVNHVGVDTPIYRPEATFAASTGQISFGTDFDMDYGGTFSDEEMLATMQAIKNPAWWDTMMMPGYVQDAKSDCNCVDSLCDRFSWPEGSPSPPVNINGSGPYGTNMHLNGGAIPHGGAMAHSFGIFHSAQVMM